MPMAADPIHPDKPVRPDDAGVARAAAALRAGRLVGMPTETVYGLACNALDGRAVAAVFGAKRRPSFDPLIVHVAEPDDAWALAVDVPGVARKLARAFWPGPLTLVMRKTEAIGGLVTSGLPSVGLRVPAHPVARRLIAAAGVPVAAPSANIFGGVSPTRAAHVLDGLADAVDCVLDGGPCETGVESTVVSVLTPTPTVLRLGGTTVEALQDVVGKVEVAIGGSADDAQAGKASPGMLDRHYAPRARVILSTDDMNHHPCAFAGSGLLAFADPGGDAHKWGHVEVLSGSGDLREAAANLFAALRRLDEANVRTIWAQRVPDHGLGRAINDRLRRAATTASA